MTNEEVLAETIARCDALVEEALATAEVLLIDLGASSQEIEAAIGRDGYMRRLFKEDRDAQVREVAK
jgi:hypothetical protein